MPEAGGLQCGSSAAILPPPLRGSTFCPSGLKKMDWNGSDQWIKLDHLWMKKLRLPVVLVHLMLNTLTLLRMSETHRINS